MDKLVVGSFQDTPTGSEFTGAVSAPIGKLTLLLLAGWIVFIALLFLSQAINTAINRADGNLLVGVATAAGLMLVAGVVIFAPLAVLWPLILRRNQRVEMHQVGSLTRFLEVIAREAETKAG